MNANVARWIVIAALLLPLGARAASSVTGLEGELLEGEKDEDRSPFSAVVTLGTQVGQGTFISNDYSDAPLFSNYVSAQGAYNLKDLLPVATTLTVSQVVSLEYTDPDVATGRRVDWTDTGLALTAPRLFKEPFTGISFGGSVGTTLPISMASLQHGKITATSLGITATRAIAGFTFIGSASGAYHFFTRAYQGLEADELESSDGEAFANCSPFFLAGGSSQDLCTGGYGTLKASARLRLVADYAFTDKISGGLEFRWEPLWRRTPATDQYTSPYASDSGRGSDISTGVIYVGYAIDDRFSLTASSGSQGPTRTLDGNGFRFPFFDTISAANNITAFAIDLTGSF